MKIRMLNLMSTAQLSNYLTYTINKTEGLSRLEKRSRLEQKKLWMVFFYRNPEIGTRRMNLVVDFFFLLTVLSSFSSRKGIEHTYPLLALSHFSGSFMALDCSLSTVMLFLE